MDVETTIAIRVMSLFVEKGAAVTLADLIPAVRETLDGVRPLPRLLIDYDVADWLRVSPHQLRRMIKAGQIPCLRLPTGGVVFDHDELLMWIDQIRDRPGG